MTNEFNFGVWFITIFVKYLIPMLLITYVYSVIYEKYLHWKYSKMTEEEWENWEPKTWNQFKKHFLKKDIDIFDNN